MNFYKNIVNFGKKLKVVSKKKKKKKNLTVKLDTKKNI